MLEKSLKLALKKFREGQITGSQEQKCMLEKNAEIGI